MGLQFTLRLARRPVPVAFASMQAGGAATKGKQGTKGQKQIHEENVATVNFYAIMAAMGLVSHSAVQLALFSPTTRDWVLLCASLSAQAGALFMMKKMAKALWSPSGQLLDAGLDLNAEGGFGEQCKDVVILCSITQILALLSVYFWLLLLLMPLYGFYKLWTGIIAPWIFAPAPDDGEGDEADKKRRRRDRMVKYKR